MNKRYEIKYSCFQIPIAVAHSAAGYQDAIADKQAQPTLIFNAVEWVESHGVVVGALMWRDGRWC